MLRTFEQTRTDALNLRLLGMAIFAVLIAIGAQIELYIGSPVPFTLQVLFVLLSGMVLGARDGALAVVMYLGLIAVNLPVAAGGAGFSALTGATVGYLVGFVPAAFVSGWLVEKAGDKVWQRWVAGLVGVVIIYALGTTTLKFYFDITADGATWSQAWQWGVAPFIVADMIKALLAATLVEGTRRLLMMNGERSKR
ncbi:MAG: biotin transporter BioY [Chloroflexota bacterium]